MKDILYILIVTGFPTHFDFYRNKKTAPLGI